MPGKPEVKKEGVKKPKVSGPVGKARLTGKLYSKGVIVSYRRNRETQKPNQVIVKIEGVREKTGARFYEGKKVAYVYKASKLVNGTKNRVIWGKVIGTHGSAGGVRCKFRPNLPGQALSRPCRVMFYPANGAGEPRA
uniref:Ribosomal protein L35 n=1 Tax=Oxyrrhis marina TaxID=2969 RepID=A7WQL6_OXYMA|nr:ribosomal protein L35 [Oxyrrhis marina]